MNLRKLLKFLHKDPGKTLEMTVAESITRIPNYFPHCRIILGDYYVTSNGIDTLEFHDYRTHELIGTFTLPIPHDWQYGG